MNIQHLSHAFIAHIQEVTAWAEANQTGCKRKSVGCSIVTLPHMLPEGAVPPPGELVEVLRTHNGPTMGWTCTGEKGNCGCSHAEPAAILTLMNMLNRSSKFILCCNYSPCTRCAQFIIDAHGIAGLIDAVVYQTLTEHDPRGVELLELAGLTVMKV